MQIIKKKFCLQSGTQMQIMKKVLSAIRNSKADNENSTFAIRNAIKKHDTLYSAYETTFAAFMQPPYCLRGCLYAASKVLRALKSFKYLCTHSESQI